ncbi:ribonuclease H-like domain-containing protein, partial [Tanacetum coccineum]
MKAVKEKEQLQKTVDSWKNSSKNLWKLVDSGMTSNSKVGLGYEIQSNNEVLSYEEEMNHTVFKCTEEDFLNKPLYSRFSKTDNFKGVPHPLTRDYTPKPQEEIDDSLYVYGKKGPQKPEISDSDDTSNEHSTCQSNDSEGSFGNPSEHSSESESESISVPNEMSTSKSVTTNEKDVSESKEVEPSCVTHVKTPRQQMKNQETHKVKGKNWNEMMERELGEGYSFIKKKCFVCGSLSHLIRDCDFYEKKMAREAELKKQRVFNTGNGVAKPVWNNANRVNRANHFIPRPVQLNSVRHNVNTGRANVNSVRPNVNTGRANVLFTETECLVVSPDFKMPDENQILLKVPRQHNMYSFDMKTPSLIKDYACLIAKATSDESKLCHRRFSLVFFLATKDETSGILKNFIRQVENQLNHRVKIIRSDNGSEFKNRDMLELCGNKGIKQEYSTTKTPQQNAVAERMNRTLIEAARTMLADLLLPTTFWAEAVSTSCYIFNR